MDQRKWHNKAHVTETFYYSQVCETRRVIIGLDGKSGDSRVPKQWVARACKFRGTKAFSGVQDIT